MDISIEEIKPDKSRLVHFSTVIADRQGHCQAVGRVLYPLRRRTITGWHPCGRPGT